MGKFFVFCRILMKFLFWLQKKRRNIWCKCQLELRSNIKSIAKKRLTNEYEMNNTFQLLCVSHKFCHTLWYKVGDFYNRGPWRFIFSIFHRNLKFRFGVHKKRWHVLFKFQLERPKKKKSPKSLWQSNVKVTIIVFSEIYNIMYDNTI